ncbi:hypothetical protein [Nocardia sp. NPDC056100]|uniref:hypothetical protein n=1 Tax=Nocardia sp. NPDC056100 TaxID=3345712 RepID=UPI0035DF2B1D
MAEPNALTGLKDSAAAGTFQFDRAIAESIANLCAGMIYVVEQIDRNTESLTKVMDFSIFGSGRAIASKFEKAAHDLRGKVIVDQKRTLEDLAQTFISAGKLATQTEANSEAAFNRIRSTLQSNPSFTGGRNFSQGAVTFPGWKTSEDSSGIDDDGEGIYVEKQNGQGGSHYYTVELTQEYEDKLNSLKETSNLDTLFTGAKDESPVGPEAGSSLSWDNLHADYIEMNGRIPLIADTARVWLGAANLLAQELSTFQTQTTIQFNGNGGSAWVGVSELAAKNAITGFQNSTTDLINSMKAISANLAYSVGYLEKLQTYLPEITAEAYAKKFGVNTLNQVTRLYAAKWDEWYGVGVAKSSSHIPVLQSPLDKAYQPQKVIDTGPGGVPNTGSPGGSPVTTTGGGGNPSGTQDLSELKKEFEDQLKTLTTTEQPKTQTPSTTTTTDTTSQITSLLSTLAQQGSSLAQSLASTGSSLIQSLQKSATTTDTTADQLKTQLQQQLAALTNLQTTPTDPNSPGGGSPKSPSGGGGPTAVSPKENPQSKLFPRSTVSSTDKDENVVATRAGLATGAASTSGTGTTGSSGAPMGSGAQAGSQGAGKEHKRPEFLRSGENLAEGLGDLPIAVTPVAEK